MENTYLKWLAAQSGGVWWHDSADMAEVKAAVKSGAVGITTNPVLVSQALPSKVALLERHRGEIDAAKGQDARAEKIIEVITKELAELFAGVYEKTQGQNGYVCAQVNPNYPGDADYMIENALRIAAWAPNISVKLPVTAAGLEALEECVAQGVNVTGTVSFTVPQVLAVRQAFEKGMRRAGSKKTKQCNAVIMVGRLDDYLRDVAHDSRAGVAESSIICAGTAAMKRAYGLFTQEKGIALLQPAGMRGAYHATDLAGGDLRFSIHPKIQKLIADQAPPLTKKMDEPVDGAVLKDLQKLREFTRAYEPDGMTKQEFITYGVAQKTLAQFVDAWNVIAAFRF